MIIIRCNWVDIFGREKDFEESFFSVEQARAFVRRLRALPGQFTNITAAVAGAGTQYRFESLKGLTETLPG